MTNVAWEPTYEHVPFMYDVLMANGYPAFNSSQNAFASSINDSRVAAAAVRKNAKHSFVYCPGCYDQMMSDQYVWTTQDLRYLYYAPICHGAGGIVAWRLRYASPEYAKETVLPLMNEIAGLREYWLGEDVRTRFSSNRDKETKTSFRLEYRPDWVEYADAGPACLWVARQHRSDETVLLLAVNNLQSDVTTRFSIPSSYKTATKYPSSGVIGLHNGVMELTFKGQEDINVILSE